MGVSNKGEGTQGGAIVTGAGRVAAAAIVAVLIGVATEAAAEHRGDKESEQQLLNEVHRDSLDALEVVELADSTRVVAVATVTTTATKTAVTKVAKASTPRVYKGLTVLVGNAKPITFKSQRMDAWAIIPGVGADSLRVVYFSDLVFDAADTIQTKESTTAVPAVQYLIGVYERPPH